MRAQKVVARGCFWPLGVSVLTRRLEAQGGYKSPHTTEHHGQSLTHLVSGLWMDSRLVGSAPGSQESGATTALHHTISSLW